MLSLREIFFHAVDKDASMIFHKNLFEACASSELTAGPFLFFFSRSFSFDDIETIGPDEIDQKIIVILPNIWREEIIYEK